MCIVLHFNSVLIFHSLHVCKSALLWVQLSSERSGWRSKSVPIRWTISNIILHRTTHVLLITCIIIIIYRSGGRIRTVSLTCMHGRQDSKTTTVRLWKTSETENGVFRQWPSLAILIVMMPQENTFVFFKSILFPKRKILTTISDR